MRYAAEILSRFSCRRDTAMAAVCLRFTRSFGGFAALAAAEAVKIERNSRGGDSGDERR